MSVAKLKLHFFRSCDSMSKMMVIVLAFISIFNIAYAAPKIKNVSNDVITKELGSRIKIDSTVLAETREVIVSLPASYQGSEQQYPVIYLLDGNRHIQHAPIAMNILQQESMVPESIIVAITNNAGTRGRDLARENKKFLQFIAAELMPWVDKNYRTNQFRTLFGHSMAGAFTLNVFATQPSLFNNYIAASPVVQMNDEALLTNLKQLFSKKKTLNQSIYFTLTDAPAEVQGTAEALDAVISFLQASAPADLDWHYQFFAEHVHMTTPYLTLFDGLSKVFKDYQIPQFVSYQDYESQGGMQGLEQFYHQRADKYMVAKAVPERVVRRLGLSFMDTKPEQAVDILLANSKKHSESPGALFALGRSYENVQSEQKALKAYQDALALAEKQSAASVDFLGRQLKRYQTKLAEN